MKKLTKLFGIMILSSGLLVGCSSDGEAEGTSAPTESEQEEKQEAKKEADMESVVKAFEEAGLDFEAKELKRDDMGMAPWKHDDGRRILIPQLGEDSGGRLLYFAEKAPMYDVLNYYEEMGKESAMLYSHLFTAENDGFYLLQISGELEESEAKKFEKALREIGDPVE